MRYAGTWSIEFRFFGQPTGSCGLGRLFLDGVEAGFTGDGGMAGDGGAHGFDGGGVNGSGFVAPGTADVGQDGGEIGIGQGGAHGRHLQVPGLAVDVDFAG